MSSAATLAGESAAPEGVAADGPEAYAGAHCSLQVLIDAGEPQRLEIGRCSLGPADSIEPFVERLRAGDDVEQG